MFLEEMRERPSKIILPAIIREFLCDDRQTWIAETAMVEKVEFLKVPKELICCKYCKHRFDGEHNKNCCEVLMEKAKWLIEIPTEDDWFCGSGELKHDEVNKTNNKKEDIYMVRYATVHFNRGRKDGAFAQWFLMNELRKAKIIFIKKKDIDSDYEKECKKYGGCTHNYCLRSEEQYKTFCKIMHSENLKKPWITWRTSKFLGKDSEFRKWLEERGEYVDGRS